MKHLLNNKGSIAVYVLFSWLLLIAIILLMFAVEIYFINLKAEETQNDILLSNLATYKNIDLKALGDTPSVFRFSDPQQALDTFTIYIKKNMDLDDNMVGRENSKAAGQVVIKRYIIYNIIGNGAEIFTYNNETNSFGKTTIADIAASPVFSPAGTRILKTSIHTTLEFPVETVLKGIVGNTKTVEVMADTDITR